MRLRGKAAIVTGASRGIGAAIARRLASEGVRLIVTYATNRAAADSVVQSIEQDGGEARALQADLGEAGVARTLVDAALADFERLDVVVNNAGIGEFIAIDDITPEHVRRHFTINVEGTIAMCVAAARVLPHGGRIVNVSSIAARGGPRRGVYGASKAAIESLTRSFAADLGARGITVNCVAPGPTQTDMFYETFSAAEIAELPKRALLGRVGVPEDVAACVAFLASEDASHVTGAVIPVDGGRS